jgi:hypothetical protein
MKQPTKTDFHVEVDDAVIRIFFRPTESHYDYYLLADGGLSRAPIIRHAKTGDTGNYAESDIEEMAYELAQEANLRSRQQRS